MLFKNDEEYFADSEFISNSQIKDFKFCQYLYEGKYLTKIFKDDEEHDYFTYGSAVDCLLTEPEGMFEQRFLPIDRRIDLSEMENLKSAVAILEEEIKVNTAEGKPVKMLTDRLDGMKKKISLMQNAAGKTQITIGMFENVSMSAQELLRQPLYKLFGVGKEGGAQEIITAEIDGLKMKGKLDYINVDKKVIADVKTVSTMEKFKPLEYAQQLAYYRILAADKYKIDKSDWDCYLLVVDKGTHVKRSEIFYISKELIDQAEAELLQNLEKFKEVKAAGFYVPITEMPDVENARKDKCFNCVFYNQCSFSVQKEITKI